MKHPSDAKRSHDTVLEPKGSHARICPMESYPMCALASSGPNNKIEGHLAARGRRNGPRGLVPTSRHYDLKVPHRTRGHQPSPSEPQTTADLVGCSPNCLPSTQAAILVEQKHPQEYQAGENVAPMAAPTPHELAMQGRRYPLKNQTNFRKF